MSLLLTLNIINTISIAEFKQENTYPFDHDKYPYNAL